MRGEGVITAISGCYPWFSVDALLLSEDYKRDSSAQINACLNCAKDICTNCMHSTPVTSEKTKQLERFRLLTKKGMERDQICDELHITKRTYYRYQQAACAV